MRQHMSVILVALQWQCERQERDSGKLAGQLAWPTQAMKNKQKGTVSKQVSRQELMSEVVLWPLQEYHDRYTLLCAYTQTHIHEP